MVMKKENLFLFGIVFILGCLVFVIATSTFNFPVANGNYSTTLVFNCTTDLPNALNASLLYNASGGTATEVLVTVENDTASDTEFYNGNVVLSGLSDGSLYNMTCIVYNATDSEYSVSVGNITIDNTPPSVVNFTNTLDGVIYGSSNTSTIVNFSVTDALIGVDSVYLNVTNSSGDEVSFNKTSSPGGGYYNFTLDLSALSEGTYNLTVFSNDSLNNQNNTEKIGITIDTTAPVLSLSSSSFSRTSLTLSISGAEGTCTSNRSGATISGSTLTEEGLSCGTSYSYIVTCVDSAGNSGSSASTSFSTTACSTGGGSSSSYINKIVLAKDKFEKGYTIKKAVNTQFNVNVDGSSHSILLKSINSNKVTLEIASTPQIFYLGIGEEAKADVTNNGYYDIYVRLLDIENNKVELFIQKINEKIIEIPESIEGEEAEKESTSSQFSPELSPIESESGKGLLITFIIFILVGIVAAVIVFLRKNK